MRIGKRYINVNPVGMWACSNDHLLSLPNFNILSFRACSFFNHHGVSIVCPLPKFNKRVSEALNTSAQIVAHLASNCERWAFCGRIREVVVMGLEGAKGFLPEEAPTSSPRLFRSCVTLVSFDDAPSVRPKIAKY